jgi:hypothetical protein
LFASFFVEPNACIANKPTKRMAGTALTFRTVLIFMSQVL